MTQRYRKHCAEVEVHFGCPQSVALLSHYLARKIFLPVPWISDSSGLSPGIHNALTMTILPSQDMPENIQWSNFLDSGTAYSLFEFFIVRIWKLHRNVPYSMGWNILRWFYDLRTLAAFCCCCCGQNVLVYMSKPNWNIDFSVLPRHFSEPKTNILIRI